MSAGPPGIASASHPTIRETLSLDDFGRAAHLVYRPAVGSHRAIDSLILDECAKHGITRREVLQVSHGLGVAELIARTDLIACVPGELGQWCERRGDIKVVPLPVTIPAVELSQYWHDGLTAMPASRGCDISSRRCLPSARTPASDCDRDRSKGDWFASP